VFFVSQAVLVVKALVLFHPDNLEVFDSRLTRFPPCTLPSDARLPASLHSSFLLLGAAAALRDSVVVVEQGIYWHRTGQMTNLTLLSCLLVGTVALVGWLDRLSAFRARGKARAPIAEDELDDGPGVQRVVSYVRMNEIR
jgi:hypothetical protein